MPADKSSPGRFLANSKRDYFIFSAQYLVLTMLIYAALVMAPYMLVKGNLLAGGFSLLAVVVCFRLIRAVLSGYFSAYQRSRQFSEIMALLTVFPPFLGPIIVLAYSLERSA